MLTLPAYSEPSEKLWNRTGKNKRLDSFKDFHVLLLDYCLNTMGWMSSMCRVQLVFLTTVLKSAGGHLHASCSITTGLPVHFISWCVEVMHDSKIPSFRPLLIFRQKKKHPGKNFRTDSHTLVKTEQGGTAILQLSMPDLWVMGK